MQVCTCSFLSLYWFSPAIRITVWLSCQITPQTAPLPSATFSPPVGELQTLPLYDTNGVKQFFTVRLYISCLFEVHQRGLQCISNFTLHSSASLLFWGDSEINSLSVMSCHLLCIPFSLELTVEKRISVLRSYQSSNIVAGLVKVWFYEILKYLRWLMCLSIGISEM